MCQSVKSTKASDHKNMRGFFQQKNTYTAPVARYVKGFYEILRNM